MFSLTQLRKQIGNAIWLFEWLAQLTPEWTGERSAYAACGALMSDAQLAVALGRTASTIARYRLALKQAGVLDWLVKPGCGRVFILQRTAVLGGTSSGATLPQTKRGERKSQKPETAPSAPERWVQ